MTTTILVIDDSEDDQRLYQRAFKDFEYVLILASSAEAGFARIADASPDSKRPDLILLDFNLPDMDGLSFMKMLAEYLDTPIPIIMLTGEGSTEVAVDAMKQGANDYIIKDIEGRYLRLLPGVVERVMATHAQREQTRSAEELLHELRVHQIELEMQNEELRRAQIIIEESRDRYVDLYEFAPVGYLTLTREGKMAEANLTATALLRVERKKLLNHHFASFVTPEGCDQWHLHFLSVMQHDGQQSCELALRREDDSVFHAQLDCLHIRDGDVSSMRIALSDITERKKAEVILKKHKLVIDSANDGYWVTDMMGNLLDANKAYASMSGYTIDELIKMHISQLDAIDQPEDVEARGARIIAQGHERFETRHRHKDGHLIDIEVSVAFMPEVQQFFVFSHDITERKRSKQELMALNNQLTHEVEKRTSDLSELTAHIQKITETERANLARELHDELGSTLVGISMEVGRLKGKTSDPDRLQDLALIKDLVSHATQTTRNVVSQLYPTILDTYGFTAAVEWLVNEYRKHSGIEVELLLPKEDVVMEQTFALAAYRITQECLTNIAKHAGASKVHIEATAINGFFDLTIHDNGKGLSGGTQTSGHGIFGMIERARYLGGSMEVGSVDGKGTTAHLRLPLAATKPKNKKMVLVVDDHAIVRDALRQLLCRETDDFSVEGEAADGNAAIQMAIEGVWDIMLLDISLPKKNGITVLEEVMAVKPSLPILMLSSHSEEEYGEIARSKGAAGYIEKGETNKLIEAMRRATLLQ